LNGGAAADATTVGTTTTAAATTAAATAGTTTTKPVSEAEYRALAKFRRALRSFLAFSEAAARQAGLTPAQHQLLLAVRGCESPPPTVGEVADALKLRHHSAVELLNRAETAGLVVRVTDSSDRRRQHVELTDLGREKLDWLAASHRDELRRLRSEGLSSLAALS
jgi:DNA-binding MarR family transcriptional regulator